MARDEFECEISLAPAFFIAVEAFVDARGIGLAGRLFQLGHKAGRCQGIVPLGRPRQTSERGTC